MKRFLLQLPDAEVWTADFDGMLDEPGKPAVLIVMAEVKTREGALAAARALTEHAAVLPFRRQG